jgi:outer membrane protein assembly factor BamB
MMSFLQPAKRLSGVLLLTAVFSTLSGCETTEEIEELKVAELQPINIKRHVEVEWREQAGDGVANYYSNLQPAISGDLIFAASRTGEVFAYSKKTGKEVWGSDVRPESLSLIDRILLEELPSAKVSGGITAAYDNLYVGTEDGEVIALSQDNGEVLWRTEVKGEVVSAPAAGEGWIAVTTTSGHVAALHPDTGELRWQVETDVPALSLRGTSSPTIAGGGVLFGTATGKLSVVVLNKGLTAWEAAISKIKGATELERLVDLDTQPVIAGSTVYTIAYNGNLAAVDMASGQVKWKREYSSYRNLSIEGNTLFLTTSKGVVAAVDATTGVEKWSVSEFYNRRLTKPVVYKDTVVVGDFEGYFHFLDKNDGSIVSRFKYDDYDYSGLNWFISWFTSEDRTAYAAPVIDGELLYIQTRDGELTAVSLP